jgi:hypothetical protein
LQQPYRAAETGTVTEANFTNYARQQVTAANWTTIGLMLQTLRQQQTLRILSFQHLVAQQNVITHVIIADALSSGNILFVGALDASKTIADGDIFRINAGNLTVELK